MDLIDSLNKLESFLDIFSTRACALCGKTSAKHLKVLCQKCRQKLPAIDFRDSIKRVEEDKIFFASLYAQSIKDLMLRYKSKEFYLCRLWAELLFSYWAENQLEIYELSAVQRMPKAIYVAAVPLHKTKKQARGYNQAELIAKYFSKLGTKHSQIKHVFIKDMFKRDKLTERLATKTKEERQSILKNAFSLNLKNKHVSTIEAEDLIILIDDISTTGITLISLKKELESQLNGVKIIMIASAGRNI